MRIWIDLANSPHVLFFAPIIKALKSRDIETLITGRSFAQTIDLANQHDIPLEVIGVHGGRGALNKARALAERSVALYKLARRFRPDASVSHNSYAHAAASRLLGTPYVAIMDFEHTPANHLSFRLARKVILPEWISLSSVRRFGVRREKLAVYRGFKEQVYLDTFETSLAAIETALPAIDWRSKIVIVARPPADFAIYHRFTNDLFGEWLATMATNPAVQIVVLPRTGEQRKSLQSAGYSNVFIPETSVDGPNLIYHADLVVSAGGTMNREAAILGVPAYSMFLGPTAAVDRELASLGRLTFVRDRTDVARIKISKKKENSRLRNPELRDRIVEEILASVRTPT